MREEKASLFQNVCVWRRESGVQARLKTPATSTRGCSAPFSSRKDMSLFVDLRSLDCVKSKRREFIKVIVGEEAKEQRSVVSWI